MMQSEKKNKMKNEGYGEKGLPVHSQVRKIKQESWKIIIDWWPEQPEITAALSEMNRQLSRSPLGIVSVRPISVGDS